MLVFPLTVSQWSLSGMAVKLRLHLILAEQGMSQRELEVECKKVDPIGISLPTINAYCQNSTSMILLHSLDILCRALNCSLSDLIIRESEES